MSLGNPFGLPNPLTSAPTLPGILDENLLTDLTQSPQRMLTLMQGTQAQLQATMAPTQDDWYQPLLASHPRPVVLVHGTFGNRDYTWTTLLAALREAGHRVFRLDYGKYPSAELMRLFGLADVRESAKELAVFVDKVLENTGAEQVDLVGFSQGGMMPRQYIKFCGGAAKVRNLVAISPSNHGLTEHGMTRLALQIPGVREIVGDAAVGTLFPALRHQHHESDFIRELNDGGETVAGIRYTTFWTTWDEIVNPPEWCVLTPASPDHEVVNIRLQDLDPQAEVPHLGMTYHPAVVRETLAALAAP
jgi:triacylglycerol esterase/lipase EstA (alpha/beta hydrolase family)